MNALREWLSFDGFAWQWILLSIPLPLLLHAAIPARGGDDAALRVPWGDRLQRVANAGALAASPRGFPWLAFIAWSLLCVAAARPQQLGPAIVPPQVGRDMMLAVDLSASMGEEDGPERRAALRPYQVTEALMALACPNALFLHCLPMHRGEEATTEVADGPRSVIFDQAENRLHMHKAILALTIR